MRGVVKVKQWFLAVLAILLVPLAFSSSVRGAQLSSRSLLVASSQAGVVTNHLFSFTVPSADMVGSIVFEYCVNTPLFNTACVPPAGLDVSLAALDSESGETGFSIDISTTANRLVLTRPAALTVPGPSQYNFSNITNPSTSNQTTFVRISLHSSSDGTGPSTDEGALAFSTANPLTTTAFVPPFLIFCVGISVAADCSSATGTFIDLGELNDNVPNTGTSQYAGATNDTTGFTVSVFGTSLTSGNDVIPALTTQNPSIAGTSQFGINLRDNSNPNVGLNPTGLGTSTAAAAYNTPNSFRFVSGDVTSSVSTPTHFNTFTITYLVNVAPNQPAGIYNATYTYVAVASF